MKTRELEKIALAEALKQGIVLTACSPIFSRYREIGSVKFTFDMIDGGETIVTLKTDTGEIEDVDFS